jgi:hypothetical protein
VKLHPALRVACASALAAALPAQAHGFGQRYDLPIPLPLYLTGAALTVAVSCAMLATYVRAAPAHAEGWRFTLVAESVARGAMVRCVVALLRWVAVALYLLIVAAGLLGNQNPFKNIAPVAVWALWWVGMAYASALVGDLWKIASPLETIFRTAERLGVRPLNRAMPRSLGVWPALFLYLVFLWMELAWESSDHPAALSMAILAYSALTWAGMFVFGTTRWLAHAEAFANVFGTLARFSPSDIRVEEGRLVEWRLRPYAVGLLARDPLALSQTALVVTILASVSFDGFMETPAWAALVEAADWPPAAIRTLGLAFAPLDFLAVYALFCALIARAGNRGLPPEARVPVRRVAGLFALTLVPIAIAYEIAHYLSFLAMAGQYAIPQASDPLGLGWDLFGTANYFVRLGLVDARMVWYVSVVAIVAGHIAALYLGHVLSLREFAGRRAALRSQLPMLVLMVGYTMLSLWIIAQPIVSTR